MPAGERRRVARRNDRLEWLRSLAWTDNFSVPIGCGISAANEWLPEATERLDNNGIDSQFNQSTGDSRLSCAKRVFIPHKSSHTTHTRPSLNLLTVCLWTIARTSTLSFIGRYDVLVHGETNLSKRGFSLGRVRVHHMVKPATHVAAVFVSELHGEVSLNRTIGGHPEVTLGHTYTYTYTHALLLNDNNCTRPRRSCRKTVCRT